MKNNRALMLRNPKVPHTERRVEDIFSAPRTRRLWEEIVALPNFQKIASKLKSQEEATKAAILEKAKKLVDDEGKSFDEAVQESIMFYKHEVQKWE